MLNNYQHTGENMNIHQLRAKAGREELDYLFLKSALDDLAYPRNKINKFLRSGALLRVKKGLYIFGAEARREAYHLEVLANLIYGPSAISLEYALSYYGLIPERVYTITSITNKRSKHFSTPVGKFDYYYLNTEKYAIGITCQQLDAQHSILIATPEKALADILLLTSPKIALKNKEQLEQYFFEDLRIEPSSFLDLNPSLMKEIALKYRHPSVKLLQEYLKK